MNYRKLSAKILFLMFVNSCGYQQAMYRTSLYKPAAPTAASQSAVATTGNQKQFAVPITQASTDFMQQATAQPQSQPWTNQQFSGAFKTTHPNLFRASSKMTRDEAFKILDLKGDETEAQIKAAYRKAVLAAHPDTGGDAEKMKLVNEAMSVIRNGNQNHSHKNYDEGSWSNSEQRS